MESKILISREICIGCGLCSKICRNEVISIENNKPVVIKPMLCCSCGHCAAICPKGAITSIQNQNYRAFRIDAYMPEISEIAHLLRSKRSIRDFTEVTPTNEEISTLISYAEKAPSSTNKRHRKYVVITNKDLIQALESAVVKSFKPIYFILNPIVLGIIHFINKKLASSLMETFEDIAQMQKSFKDNKRPIFYNAPCLILILAPKADIQAKDDCIIAQQYMMLYAESVGISSCINGYAQYVHRTVENLLALPKGYSLFSVGMFGYAKHCYRHEITYTTPPDIIWR